MDVLSVAEIRKRFIEKPVMGLRSPQSPIIHAESALDSSDSDKSEQPKSISANRSFDTSSSTTVDVMSSSSSQETHDASASRDAKLVRTLPQGVNNLAQIKKPPVPLPASASQNRHEDTYSIVSTIPADPMPHPVLPSSVNNPPSSRKPPAPLPTSANRDQSDGSFSVSLDSMLPSRCPFFDLDNVMGDYQRRNPRAIIYPKQKPPMPTMTTTELNHLQKYSNA